MRATRSVTDDAERSPAGAPRPRCVPHAPWGDGHPCAIEQSSRPAVRPGNCAARASFWNLGGSQRANCRGGRPDRSTHSRRSALARRCDGDGVRTDRSLPQGLPTSLEPETEHRIAAFGRGGTSASRRSWLTRPRSIAFITSTRIRRYVATQAPWRASRRESRTPAPAVERPRSGVRVLCATSYLA
jgi:hypothetical protein